MKIPEIEILLAKYYEGQTSLEEESVLHRYFSESEVPEHLQADRDLFLGLATEKTRETIHVDFEKDILGVVEETEIAKTEKRRLIPQRLYWISGVAASLMLLIASYFFLQSNSMQDTYNNPQLAYSETKKILSYVSTKINKGLDPVEEGLYTFNNGTDELGKLSKMSMGMDKVQSVSNLYEKAYPVDYLNLLNKPGEIIEHYIKK